MFSSGSSRANSIGTAPDSSELAKMFAPQQFSKPATKIDRPQLLSPTATTGALGPGKPISRTADKNVPATISKTIQVANPAYSAALAAMKSIDNAAVDEKKAAKNGAPKKPAASLPAQFITKTVSKPNPAYQPQVPVAPRRTIASQFVEVPVKGGATAPKLGDLLGAGVTQGRNGLLNAATQNSLAWRNATGQNGWQGGGNRDGTAQSLNS